jgi:hypothetical protein
MLRALILKNTDQGRQSRWHKKIVVVLVSSIIFLAGCTYRKFDFTVLTTEKINVTGLDRGRTVTGEDCAIFFLLPWGFPDATTAMNRALDKGQGDFLVDVTIERKVYFWLVGTTQCEEVTGTIVRTVSSPQVEPP